MLLLIYLTLLLLINKNPLTLHFQIYDIYIDSSLSYTIIIAN